MMKPGGLLLAGVAFTLAAAGCGGSRSENRASAAPGSSAPAPARPTPVVAPPEASSSGELLSVLSVEREVDLLAQRDGLVVALDSEEGATAEKGTVLARLDDRSLTAQLDKARADLHVAESNVKYNEAEVKARQAHLRRAQQMFDSGLGSQADLDEADFRAKGSAYDLESWRAVVEKNRAELRSLEIELEKTRIRAPFRGVVVHRYIRDGQNILKDGKCFRLSQLSPLLVRFLVPETDKRRPVAGDRVRGVLASDAHRTFEARIRRVSPTVDPGSGSYEVTAQLVEISAPDLRPGMAVRLRWREASPPKP